MYVRVLYLLALLLIGPGLAFGAISALVAMFSDSFWQGLALLIVTPLTALMYVIMTQIGLELIMVAFRIMDNTSVLAAKDRSA